jgi:hypothetical protein
MLKLGVVVVVVVVVVLVAAQRLGHAAVRLVVQLDVLRLERLGVAAHV